MVTFQYVSTTPSSQEVSDYGSAQKSPAYPIAQKCPAYPIAQKCPRVSFDTPVQLRLSRSKPIADRKLTFEKNATRRIWTTKEDNKLCELVAKLGRNWRAVAAQMPGRSFGGCEKRYRDFDPRRLHVEDNCPKTPKSADKKRVAQNDEDKKWRSKKKKSEEKDSLAAESLAQEKKQFEFVHLTPKVSLAQQIPLSEKKVVKLRPSTELKALEPSMLLKPAMASVQHPPLIERKVSTIGTDSPQVNGEVQSLPPSMEEIETMLDELNSHSMEQDSIESSPELTSEDSKKPLAPSSISSKNFVASPSLYSEEEETPPSHHQSSIEGVACKDECTQNYGLPSAIKEEEKMHSAENPPIKPAIPEEDPFDILATLDPLLAQGDENLRRILEGLDPEILKDL